MVVGSLPIADYQWLVYYSLLSRTVVIIHCQSGSRVVTFVESYL